MLTEKNCKGTGQAIGHGCGKKIPVALYGKPNRIYGLGKSCGCYNSWLLNTEQGQEKIKRATLKATKARRDLEQAAKEIQEEKKRERLGDVIAATQQLVNKYIRIRDKGMPCISQNIAWKKDFDAGHCYNVKQFNSLRFDYDNIHGQSRYANRMKDGDHANYLLNLPSRIGKQRADALIQRAMESRKSIKKWTREELKKIQQVTKEKIKQLEQNAHRP